MLDLKNILSNPGLIREKLSTRGFEIDLQILEEEAERRRNLIQEKEKLASDKNIISDSFKGASNDAEKKKLMNESKNIDEKVKLLKQSLYEVETKLNNYLLGVPNIPHITCPVGESDSDNKIINQYGNIETKNTEEHSEILEKFKMLSFEDGVTLAQSRFVVMSGKIASLHRALINFMLAQNINKSYNEYNVPYICNAESLTGTGQLPKFEEDLFKISDSNLYLIPTAEVPLTNLLRNKILLSNDLPIMMTAHTPCFRSEAGSYGLDTKGMIRQHQFEKIELVQVVHPDKSDQALEDITLHARSILDDLELPYQIVELCTGDLGFSSQKTYDLEVWFPSQNKYREISSCSNFGDFQSRRLNIKFRHEKKKDYVHTLNGSGLAVGRTLAAIVENCFDGNKITIPEVLHQYLDFKTIEL